MVWQIPCSTAASVEFVRELDLKKKSITERPEAALKAEEMIYPELSQVSRSHLRTREEARERGNASRCARNVSRANLLRFVSAQQQNLSIFGTGTITE